MDNNRFNQHHEEHDITPFKGFDINNIRNNMPSSRIILLAVLGIMVLWGLSGFYTVRPEERGIVLRFGAFHRLATEGLNYHFPYPFESVEKVSVQKERLIRVGFRGNMETRSFIPKDDRQMLTGDGNIVEISFSIFWRVDDPVKYLLQTRNPESMVKRYAESFLRQIVGQSEIQPILSQGRVQIQNQTRILLQETLDALNTGILITQIQLNQAEPPAAVVDAFRDVERASADKEKRINEAEAYRNKIIPEARGKAKALIETANGYKLSKISQSLGETQRFLDVYRAYLKSPEVFKTRYYLEKVGEVLQRTNNQFIDPSLFEESGVVPFLPLGTDGQNQTIERKNTK